MIECKVQGGDYKVLGGCGEKLFFFKVWNFKY